MMVSAEDMHGLLPAIEAETPEASRSDLRIDAAPPQRPPAAGGITRAGFLDQIDSCVRDLAAMLAGPAAARHSEPSRAEHARVELWRWLHAGDAMLDDGTPIDFTLFDAAIQRVGERLPRRGLPGQENILQAAWLLAELTHARTLTESAQVPALARTL
jgi:malate synthase